MLIFFSAVTRNQTISPLLSEQTLYNQVEKGGKWKELLCIFDPVIL